MRDAKKIEYNGKSRTFSEWSKITGIPEFIIRNRIGEFNWSIGEALGFEERAK